ncbi:Abc transporter [Operophtera brumata]|uniref:Abc transporter n=1 Tax=Operophtera brumata TaxID=104452 RepID=A0A0L7L182_OPEBR|nr:Abc transporter [Operophtera brumata]
MSKREEAPYAAEDAQVVGLNFHQSKEIPGKVAGTVADITSDCAEECGGGCLNVSAPIGNVTISFTQKHVDSFDPPTWTTRGKIRALIQKNFLRMWRNIGVMLFIFVLPVMQAVVNDDVNVINGDCPFNSSCSMKNLSCRYLDQLVNHTIKEYYADLTSALDAVRDGKAWGALYFNENYTDSLNLLETCHYNPKLGDIPIDFMDPIYGNKNPSFTDFVAPGVILT